MDDLGSLPSFWEGFVVASSTLSNSELLIELTPDPPTLPRCGCCRQYCKRIHDITLRRIRDRNCFEYRTSLDVPVRRLDCDSSGVHTEYISWLRPHARQA